MKASIILKTAVLIWDKTSWMILRESNKIEAFLILNIFNGWQPPLTNRSLFYRLNEICNLKKWYMVSRMRYVSFVKRKAVHIFSPPPLEVDVICMGSHYSAVDSSRMPGPWLWPSQGHQVTYTYSRLDSRRPLPAQSVTMATCMQNTACFFF